MNPKARQRSWAPLVVGLVESCRELESALAERERELLALKGPCGFKGCRLHFAHSGPHEMPAA